MWSINAKHSDHQVILLKWNQNFLSVYIIIDFCLWPPFYRISFCFHLCVLQPVRVLIHGTRECVSRREMSLVSEREIVSEISEREEESDEMVEIVFFLLFLFLDWALDFHIIKILMWFNFYSIHFLNVIDSACRAFRAFLKISVIYRSFFPTIFQLSTSTRMHLLRMTIN